MDSFDINKYILINICTQFVIVYVVLGYLKVYY